MRNILQSFIDNIFWYSYIFPYFIRDSGIPCLMFSYEIRCFFLFGKKNRRSFFLSLLFNYRIRCINHDRNSRFNNSCFLEGNIFESRTQKFFMVIPNTRNSTHKRMHDIGAIEQSSNAYLYDCIFTLLLLEIFKSNECTFLKIREINVQINNLVHDL